MRWDPDQYLKYADERFRPAYDLIAQIALQSPALICDLGCGTGHLTKVLAERWPDAKVIGIDSSEEMLKIANTLSTDIKWENQDIKTWEPKTNKFDIIFSNSVLHWLGDHETLFKKLLAVLNPNGVLAIQMPNNFKEPTHTTAFEVINENKEWGNKLLPFLNHEPIHDFNFYYDLFCKSGSTINAWETTYYHILSGHNPVVEWIKGSFLKPLLDQMSADDKIIFLDKISHKILQYYPQQADGKTILPFKRLFLIATKR
jgi:trans-aconitate 2-methyltransferase